MLTTIGGVALFLLGLSVLVAIHELGHLWMARAWGVATPEFRVGFGRALIGRTDRRGTHWGLGWIPLGGFVRLARHPSRLSEDEAGKQGPVREAETLDAAPPLGKFLIALAGPLANIVLAAALLIAAEYQPRVIAMPVIEAVAEDSRAAAAGFRAGDRIRAVDERAVEHWGEVNEALIRALGRERITLVIADEAGETRELALQGEMLALEREDRWIFEGWGLTPAPVSELAGDERLVLESGVGESIERGLERTWASLTLILSVIGALVTGALGVDTLSSPIGIAAISNEIVALGWAPWFGFLGFFSLNLAVFNLLPLPPLDGYHMATAVFERVTGILPGERVERWIMNAGFALIITFAVMVAAQDVYYLWLD